MTDCLLLATTASAPRTALLSPLNTSPVRAPVNASRTASQQCPAHDSGAAWIATPSLRRTCTVYLLPVSRRTAAQWLAYALPYRRFVAVLADVNARLGADVGRYSFIVVDLHHLLLAGLPAHFESHMPSHAVQSSE